MKFINHSIFQANKFYSPPRYKQPPHDTYVSEQMKEIRLAIWEMGATVELLKVGRDYYWKKDNRIIYTGCQGLKDLFLYEWILLAQMVDVTGKGHRDILNKLHTENYYEKRAKAVVGIKQEWETN